MEANIKDTLLGALHSKTVWLAFVGLIYTALETFQPTVMGWIPLAFKPVVASAYFFAMVYVRALTTEPLKDKAKKTPKVDDTILKDF